VHQSSIEVVHQLLGIALGEAAAEVAGGGGTGDAFGSRGIEEDLVITSDLDVLQALATGQEVVGDVQDVVALVVGLVPLQEVEVPIDVVDQSELPGQEVDGPMPPGAIARTRPAIS